MAEPLRISLVSPQINRISLATPISSAGARLTIDTTYNWTYERCMYIPVEGEIIVYSDRRTIDEVVYPGIKIGDGLAYVVDLPFLSDDNTAVLTDLLQEHIADFNLHVSNEEREHWNNKVSCGISGERLYFESGGINA